MDMAIYMWVTMMAREDEYEKVLKHAKDGHALLMMMWYVAQVKEVGLL